MTKRLLPTMPTFPGRRSLALDLVPLALLLAAGGTGCYRATGIARPTVVAEQIPETGGDRVIGNKATAGTGDYYLGNDYMHLAVDGAVFGDRPGQFGAPSGGAILDIGGIALDQSFKRVSLPSDNVERIGPVANQDPDLPFVFDRYAPASDTNSATLTMTGHLLDPKHKLAGATWDSSNRVIGIEVEHTITLGTAVRFIELQTIVRNTGASTLPLRNIADYLHQSGGGFRFVVPAVLDASGTTPVSDWGVEIPSFSDFTNPLGTSVQAPTVALMGSEPSAETLDLHQSLGIRPMDQPMVLVASDPQRALEEDRPRFPSRLVVGSLPASSLPAGQALSYRRRIFESSGPSPISSLPAQATGIFNSMLSDRSRTDGSNLGVVGYTTAGSAVLRGPRQTELRFERYTGTSADPSTDLNPGHWALERVEWREAGENFASPFAPTPVLLPTIPDAVHPDKNQPYRLLIRNRTQGETDYTFLNSIVGVITGVFIQLRPSPLLPFQIADYLSPERSEVTTDSGAGTSRLFLSHGFTSTVAASGTTIPNAYQPLRITLAGVDSTGALDATKDPDAQRIRTMCGAFNVVTRAKVFTNFNHGAYQFTAGNQIFGSSFTATDQAGAPFFFPHGSYLAFGTRGPLGSLSQLPVDVFDGQTEVQHTFLIFQSRVPTGWTSFDLPGPSQMSSGGMLPAEQLSSALAEGVQVVGRTELDRHIDADHLATEFLQEFDSTTTGRRQAINGQLFTFGARTSDLSGDVATALFTPPVAVNQPMGGARPSAGWTLADFIAQAEGQYVVLHRPRGPQGLFNKKGGIAAGVALGTGANAWWTATDGKSDGKATGDFDAIELLRAEGCDPANPSAWFAEFQALRTDWFNLLNLQTPTAFTKGLGLSSGVYSLDTPVGLARTYLSTGSTALAQTDLSPVLAALRSGAAVASTGPLLDVNLNGSSGPGSLLAGPAASATLNISLYAPSWVPVQEVRIVVNGVVVQTLDPSTFTQSTTDSRLRSTQVPLDLATLTGNKDAWVVVEAGVPLSTSGAYAVGTPWNKVMKGIYPIAVANPIFVDVNGGGYTPPLP